MLLSKPKGMSEREGSLLGQDEGRYGEGQEAGLLVVSKEGKRA